jgi:hypothetical protein
VEKVLILQNKTAQDVFVLVYSSHMAVMAGAGCVCTYWLTMLSEGMRGVAEIEAEDGRRRGVGCGAAVWECGWGIGMSV